MRACIFLSLALFCATLSAQQVDYYRAAALADTSEALGGGSFEEGLFASPEYEGACESCGRRIAMDANHGG